MIDKCRKPPLDFRININKFYNVGELLLVDLRQ
jgi:hypothetical protein